jgi:two-component sensor histidine kinase
MIAAFFPLCPLVHEVQHRVKNHMNTTKSLLSLQRQSQSDPSLASALGEAENRVTLMMSLYQKLSDDPGSQCDK